MSIGGTGGNCESDALVSDSDGDFEAELLHFDLGVVGLGMLYDVSQSLTHCAFESGGDVLRQVQTLRAAHLNVNGQCGCKFAEPGSEASRHWHRVERFGVQELLQVCGGG
ncbi:MAG: hypothetical protein V9E81_06385 [Marmoricola sp.]